MEIERRLSPKRSRVSTFIEIDLRNPELKILILTLNGACVGQLHERNNNKLWVLLLANSASYF